MNEDQPAPGREPSDVIRITDPEMLRAVAHPLRVRLLGLLRVDGPDTASGLGRRLGQTSGATSYHLRQLARYGFVVEADEQPSRRERRWKAAHRYTSWNPAQFTGDPELASAVEVMPRRTVARLVEQQEAWLSRQSAWPAEWVNALTPSDMFVRLSPAAIERLHREVTELVERAGAECADDPDARQSWVVFYPLIDSREQP
jgi:DNA-binding transcriptional ArsR family regulator